MLLEDAGESQMVQKALHRSDRQGRLTEGNVMSLTQPPLPTLTDLEMQHRKQHSHHGAYGGLHKEGSGVFYSYSQTFPKPFHNRSTLSWHFFSPPQLPFQVGLFLEAPPPRPKSSKSSSSQTAPSKPLRQHPTHQTKAWESPEFTQIGSTTISQAHV